MRDLVMCPECARHSRRSEERCPFCGTVLSAELRNATRPLAPPGLSRAKLYAFHTAVATTVVVSIASCGGSSSSDAGVDGMSNDGQTAMDGQNGNDGSSQDGNAQDSSMEASNTDASADADAMDHFVPPPPYGCVFPAEGCDDVRV